ncbi:uncharacterized protein J4E87_009831 [Alternaria ethzedia]|uniref:uncharacterized protein n=1 Tax=Alternaria ethzedia TaxID=181014 RepID=UPI0020C25130|nr:uncharacterized protein J4E87_009831 [Alternaria ethzedia]KAI4613530.1 hypothetical protein J4E87_009831 [Alternaria ethzedia]
MAATKDDCDCPNPILWEFPAPGNQDLMPSKHPQSSSFEIEQYLEASAHVPPTSGFGTVPVYINDLVKLTWPSDFNVPAASHRNLYCKPCEQDNNYNTNQKVFDWESCCRVYDKTDLTVTLDEKPGHGGIWSTSFDVMGSGMAKVPIKFSFTPEADTMVCALGFPGMLEGGLSQAFPVINKQPPSERGRHLFTEDDPEGVPWKDDATAPLRMHHIVGIVLAVALCMAFFARLFWQKRKQRKASQALMAQAESGGLMDGSKTRYTDDM